MKRCLRFSIATLLILMTVAAAYLGGYRSGRRAGIVDKTNLDHARDQPQISVPGVMERYGLGKIAVLLE
ncbi:MAG: hypothetical protein U0836_08460 [Pirellulales bacterium]